MSKTFLIVTQVYIPDPASVGQHMHDAAVEMVSRGYRVVVYAARRGYDDPSRVYAKQEVVDGVEINRLSLSSFGKQSISRRLLGGGLFVFQAFIRALFIRGLCGALVSTSPPFAPIVGEMLRLLRRTPVVFWAMDLNPDQMIALGKTKSDSLPARIFESINRSTLRNASAVIALDRFMAKRLKNKASVGNRMHIIPPWPHQQHLNSIEHSQNPFRAEQGLDGKFVVMYSGNISLAHPVTTVLEAAKRLSDLPDLVFLFIGGGLGKQKIEAYASENKLSNIRTLSYQPINKLSQSLSAADLHLVCMGESMVGVVHPCKAYGAMAVARPILLLGPMGSHIGEIVHEHNIGWQINHDEVDQAEQTLRLIKATPTDQLSAMGQRAYQVVNDDFSEKALTSQFGDAVESGISTI